MRRYLSEIVEGCAPSQPKRRWSGALHFSTLVLAQADIRDIRDPIHIPYPWLWLVYVLAGLLILAFAYWAYRAWKRRAQKVPVKLSHEIALERLEVARRLIAENKAKEFSIEVSDAVRVYIEQRFQVAAAHRTTEEFLHDLLTNKSSPLAPYSQSLEEFLKFCDLAKFAKWSLASSEMQSMYESAKRLVHGTIPKVENRRDASVSKKITPKVPQGGQKNGILIPR